MIKRRGFTLTELMLALTILGVLTALVLPMVNSNAPSRNRMMMKKAYYTIEDVVRELISDDQHYPELGSDGNTYAGFDNTTNTCQSMSELENSCKGLTKFAKLFANKLNVKGDLTKTDHGYLFETADGIYWQVEGQNNAPADVVAAGDSGLTQVITVDVNGTKKPNLIQSSTSSGDHTGTVSTVGSFRDIDRFKVFVTRNGKIIPKSGQTWFEKAISIDSSVNGD